MVHCHTSIHNSLNWHPLATLSTKIWYGQGREDVPWSSAAKRKTNSATNEPEGAKIRWACTRKMCHGPVLQKGKQTLPRTNPKVLRFAGHVHGRPAMVPRCKKENKLCHERTRRC